MLCIMSCTTEVDIVTGNSFQNLAEVELSYDLSNLSGIEQEEMPDSLIVVAYRIINSWKSTYMAPFKDDPSNGRYIFSRNIINGNALTLMCVDADGNDTYAPIVFSEWTLISGTQMQRSDYTMADLLTYNDTSMNDGMGNLFALTEEQKEEGGIFLRRYITHYKKVQDYGE